MKVPTKDSTRRSRLLPVCKQKGVRAWSRGWELNPPQSSIVVGCLLRVAASSLSAARRLNRSAFGGIARRMASPTPALRPLAPGNFDGSTIALYKASRKLGLGRLRLHGFSVGFCSANCLNLCKEFEMRDAFQNSFQTLS